MDCLDRTWSDIPWPKAHVTGKGHYPESFVPRPSALSGVPRRYGRYGHEPGVVREALRHLSPPPDLILVTYCHDLLVFRRSRGRGLQHMVRPFPCRASSCVSTTPSGPAWRVDIGGSTSIFGVGCLMAQQGARLPRRVKAHGGEPGKHVFPGTVNAGISPTRSEADLLRQDLRDILPSPDRKNQNPRSTWADPGVPQGSGAYPQPGRSRSPDPDNAGCR